MSKAQNGSLGTAVLMVAGLFAACGSTFAQDPPLATIAPAAPAVTATSPAECQPVSQCQGRVSCLSRLKQACHCGGGPYKGFYPCNGWTPYCGGACNVYGDAPIYTAPADYGYHCAAHCR